MPNYQNGKVYALRSHQTDDVYIGSTIQSLAVRKGGHKGDYGRYAREQRRYISSFEICKYDDMFIELVESYPCDSKEELHKREGHFIRVMDCVNKKIAGRSQKEYREDNKDKIKLHKKEHYEENKDTISLAHKKYYEENKDTISLARKKYREDNKDKINLQKKEYREGNKDKINLRKKEYREANKDKIKLHKKEFYEMNKQEIRRKQKIYIALPEKQEMIKNTLKIYQAKNKDSIKIKRAEYYQKHKDSIKADSQTRVDCECGSNVRKDGLPEHKRSKKHIDWSLSQNSNDKSNSK